MSRIDIQYSYLWSMLCVNISVGNRFDFALIRTNQLMICLIVCHFVRGPTASKNHYRFRCQSLSKIHPIEEGTQRTKRCKLSKVLLNTLASTIYRFSNKGFKLTE